MKWTQKKTNERKRKTNYGSNNNVIQKCYQVTKSKIRKIRMFELFCWVSQALDNGKFKKAH